ncbi:succinate dehydrogenase subunit 7, mitochondrial-like [Asparagus officinalis]|uniref:succinate dehydrogenase subunit 7, mitochondrial-like n=1 Tax=Asparagus officinalis TaxID=4686 RepID=UPI00098E267E|nr:succinate dehydrogenase subunit 7, mitochondrial-like [Asparagus officinalis]
MATALSKSNLFSKFRSSSQGAVLTPRRGYHIDLGAREKALLEEDPALKRFKSYKSTVKRVSKIGNGLTALVAAACAYEIFTVAAMRKI